MAERIEATVTMANIYSYQRPAYGYGYETAYIYNMVAEDGTVYVWKTTAFLFDKVQTDSKYDYAEIDSKGRKWIYEQINRNDIVRIKATVKGQSEYKGQPQTEVTRVKVVERIFKAKTPEELKAEREAEKARKEQEQRDSLTGKDFIWRMPYRQYKECYSDCETVENSFERRGTLATIEVIIREGRLKASGTRFEHYRYFILQNEEGMKASYKAITEENAIRRAEKEFGGHWEVYKIY